MVIPTLSKLGRSGSCIPTLGSSGSVQKPESGMKFIHALIFLLLCSLYVAGLFLYKNERDLTHQRFSRFVQREGLVASFSGHYKPMEEFLEANRQNIELLQMLRVEKPKNNYEPWQLIAQTARYFNPDLATEKAEALAKLITKKAEKYGLDPLLMTALISQESAFNARARSVVGAYGYGQLMPGTAKFLGVNSRVPEENLEGCAKYLSQQMSRWSRSDNTVALALASYNAGPGAVEKYRGIPPYRETRNYVNIITARYQTLQEASEQAQKAGKKL